MPVRRPDRPPSLVFANSAGEILDYPGLRMAGASCGRYALPAPEDLIELPPGSELFVLPGRLPVGMNPDTGEVEILESDPYSRRHPAGGGRLHGPGAYHYLFRRLPYQRQRAAPAALCLQRRGLAPRKILGRRLPFRSGSAPGRGRLPAGADQPQHPQPAQATPRPTA